jgi:hypothetical protein
MPTLLGVWAAVKKRSIMKSVDSSQIKLVGEGTMRLLDFLFWRAKEWQILLRIWMLPYARAGAPIPRPTKRSINCRKQLPLSRFRVIVRTNPSLSVPVLGGPNMSR